MKHYTVLYKIFSNDSFSSRIGRKSIIRMLLILLLGFISIVTSNAQTIITHDINTGSLVIPGNSTNNYIITGTTTSNVVTVGSGYKGKLTLKNLNITSSVKSGTNGVSGVSCITIEGEFNRSNLDPITKVDIILEGTNKLLYTASNSGCAFQVNQGAQIHINAVDPNDNTSGVLTAENTSTGSAAIGAPYFTSGHATGQGTAKQMTCDSGSSNRSKTAGGNIIIGSGTVTALANQHGAGIGGGWYTYYNGIIIVYGGVVVAQSNYHAAGIGSGCPQGSGVLQCYAENSTIVALPPAEITAKGTSGSSNTPLPQYGLNGARNITYMNDPDKSTISVHTEDYEKGVDIYIDLSETMANDGMKLEKLFQDLGINYDLKTVRVGRTDATTGIYQFNAEFKHKTTFFTDASSSHPNYLGRPYMPKEVSSIKGDKNNKVDIELELLKMDISFVDYPSTPLQVGYTSTQARANAHTIKMEYNDNAEMSNLSFRLQGGGIDFQSMIFLGADRLTEVAAPTRLNKGDVYYIVLPLKVGKPLGIYSDVLLIGGNWGTTPLPGYIRRIGLQRVVKDDTGSNEHIKVTASPVDFVEDKDPAIKTVSLTLSIDHTGTNVIYDPLDVKARYIITTEPNYDQAIAAVPLNSWQNLNIPAANAQNLATVASFSNKARGTYYVHWYVESGVVYAHSQNVTKPQHTYGGFGPYILTQIVKAGRLSGNPFVCEGQAPSEIKGEASTGGSGEFSYQWQVSLDGTNWNNVGGDTPNYIPAPLTASPTYFRRISTDKQYGGTTISDNIFAITVVSDGQTLYWKHNATNNNWNDPDNWVDVSGTPLNMIPVSCSNVYIPGGADNYPSLNPDKTPTDIYGPAVCSNITFAYGAELGYQHKLSYDKAFIQYNWGYYDNFSGVNYGDQPTANYSSPAPVKKRDTWYALAAPLKSMATGDFAFAGYPLTWQAGFALSDPNTGLKGGEIEIGNFDKKFSANDTPLSETNNAIAVKVALYQSSIGYQDHRNLEGLKGILEIPYFENNAKSVYYPGHIYDRFTKASKFFYFNPKTLQLLHSPIGLMKRDEAYRFIYEKNGVAPDISIGGIPSIVPGYEQKVRRQNSKSLKVMIGNPFMASINAKQFVQANNSNGIKIDEAAGYQIFDSNDQIWKHYTFAGGGNILPLQAFIITLTNEEANLLFPLEGTYALTKSLSAKDASDLQTGNLVLKSVNNNGLGGDYSILASTGTDESIANVKKMIYSEGHSTPETFFITSDNKNYNLIQMYEKGVREIKIGVKCSDNRNPLSLIFENANEFLTANNLCPILLDKHLGIEQNLIAKNKYDFTQRKADPKNGYIDADRFVLQLVSPDQILNQLTGISIAYNDNAKQIEVRANQNIKQVQIYDILGRQIYSESGLNTSYFVKTLSLHQGVYVVKVYTENGEIKVDKIMAL